MTKLRRHGGGGGEPTQRFRQPQGGMSPFGRSPQMTDNGFQGQAPARLREAGQGFGSRPGANGPAGWNLNQPGGMQGGIRGDYGNGSMLPDRNYQSRIQEVFGGAPQIDMGYVDGRNQPPNQQFSGPAFNQRGAEGIRNAQSRIGDAKGGPPQQQSWSSQQQGAQGAGGRNGLGNPFNSPWGAPRSGGYDFSRK